MIINFIYQNHRGETNERTVDVDSLEFIRDPGYGYQPGWFISGIDQQKNTRRSFSLNHIKFPDDLSQRFYKLMNMKHA